MTVLGCSPGTRACGIAIMRDSVLVDWEVITFRGAWSNDKLRSILEKIQTIIHEYGIEKIAIKVPDVFPTAMGYNQLIGCLNVLLENEGMNAHYFTLTELKDHCTENGVASKLSIADCIVARYSELRTRHDPAAGAPNKHHFKVFEAVCAANLLYKRGIAGNGKMTAL